jgi:hypothetical protein
METMEETKNKDAKPFKVRDQKTAGLRVEQQR